MRIYDNRQPVCHVPACHSNKSLWRVLQKRYAFGIRTHVKGGFTILTRECEGEGSVRGERRRQSTGLPHRRCIVGPGYEPILVVVDVGCIAIVIGDILVHHGSSTSGDMKEEEGLRSQPAHHAPIDLTGGLWAANRATVTLSEDEPFGSPFQAYTEAHQMSRSRLES